MEDIVSTMQKIMVDTMKATNPAGIVFGEVETTSPLTIRVDQKLLLEEQNLILTSNVMDYEVDMTVNHFTENTAGGSGMGAFDSHNHAYVGRKKFIIHNALEVGEQVLMIKNQGGQLYVVLDKVVRG